MDRDSQETFGFELLNKLIGSQIFKKEDVIILFTHWYLVKHGFKCIGLGDSKVYNGTEEGSESVTEGWNTGPNYALRYAKDGKLYILIGLKSDLDILINLLRVHDNTVSNIQFPIAQTVNELHGSLVQMMPSYKEVLHKLRNDLIEPFHILSSRDISVQTSSSGNERDIPRIPDTDPLRVGQPAGRILPQWPDADPRSVGRGDLDPFHRGGGMLFDPFGPQAGHNPMRPRAPGGLGIPGRLPPGAIPPGARFDPFGPPEVNPPFPRIRNPDNDEPLPHGYDDMFM